MKKLFFLGLCLLAARSGFAWGQKGHDVTAYIAECHLTPAAAKKIDKVLGGYSPVYFANWLDNASHTPEYAYTKTWHYLNVDEGRTLDDMPANPQGDILKAVTEIVAKLRAGGLSPEEEAFNLKMLIHLLGDMHCPMHLGRATDWEAICVRCASSIRRRTSIRCGTPRSSSRPTNGATPSGSVRSTA